MSLRFRKSIKIMKGLRINVNKGSVGMSIGGRGLGYTFNTKGRQTTHVGIPGTGLSYVNVMSRGNNSASNYTSMTSPNSKNNYNSMNSSNNTFNIGIDDNGNIIFSDANKNIITDEATINYIKKMPGYQEAKERLISCRKQMVSNEVKNYNTHIEEMININRLSPQKIFDNAYYQTKLDSLVQQKYIPKQFNLPMPNMNDIKNELYQVSSQYVKGIFFINKKRIEFVEQNCEKAYNDRMNWYLNQKKLFEENEKKIEQTENERLQKEYENEKKYLEKAICGDKCFIEQEIESWISSIEMPLEFSFSYQFYEENGILSIDLDLPEIEDFPKQKAIQLANGEQKMKDKSIKEQNADYKYYVFGLAIFIAGNIFNISPVIKEIVVSGYTQRRNKDGDIVDDYIYSIKFIREKLAQFDLVTENPVLLCYKFENRCNILANDSLKTITPF